MLKIYFVFNVQFRCLVGSVSFITFRCRRCSIALSRTWTVVFVSAVKFKKNMRNAGKLWLNSWKRPGLEISTPVMIAHQKSSKLCGLLGLLRWIAFCLHSVCFRGRCWRSTTVGSIICWLAYRTRTSDACSFRSISQYTSTRRLLQIQIRIRCLAFARSRLIWTRHVGLWIQVSVWETCNRTGHYHVSFTLYATLRDGIKILETSSETTRRSCIGRQSTFGWKICICRATTMLRRQAFHLLNQLIYNGS